MVRLNLAAHRRALTVLVGVLGGLLLLGVLWVVITGLVARSRLEGIRPEMRALRASISQGDLSRARRIGRDIESRTGSAHQLTSGPAWWVGSHLLEVGTPLRTTREVSYVLDRLSHAVVPRFDDLAEAAGRNGRSSTSSGPVDLARLNAIGADLDSIRGLVEQGIAAIRATPPSWFGPATGGREHTVAKLESIGADLSTAHRTIDTVMPMLGSERPQRYFVGFMNEAESRSLGGLPGGFAIVTADRGRISVEHIGSDDELAGVRARVDLGAEYERLYGADDPTGVIQNSDISPDFRNAARIWAGMWTARTGERVDGAVALDPTALGYLLRSSGPVTLPDGVTVSADTITNLAQSRQYQLYPGFTAAQKLRRKEFLASLAGAASTALLHAPSLTGLVPGLRQAVHERRIVMYSADASRERAIISAGLGGVLSPGNAPFSSFFVNNATGSKLDFYLRRSMTYRATGCGAQRTARATITLHNDTPPYPLPPYVTYVADGRPAGERPGFNRVIVSYYSTPGSRVSSVTLDGTTQHLTSATENGLTLVRLLVALPAGSSRTLAVVTDEPATSGHVRIVKQPLVYALNVRSQQTDCAASSASGDGGASTRPVIALVVGGLALLVAAVAVRLRNARRRGKAVSDEAVSDEAVSDPPDASGPATGTSDP